ncbi:hypothetical protein GGR42_001391 [Saonia flava]|uniref:Uncharacterized protein n=1 Tax=Saonia flava TaxID=523696 RepID=A0A846R275_9FLAO|nr:hypothetical protein [Saonia flava]NJB70929.1 hypothetical protein [Saonia flava]
MKHVSFIFFLFTALNIYSQGHDDVVKIGYNLNNQQSMGITPVYEYIVQGSPYLNKIFKMGKVILNGKTETESLMRYNIYRDHFELLDNTGKQVYLEKNSKIDIVLDGKTYQYIDYLYRGKVKFGYCTPLNHGKTILFIRDIKKVSEYKRPAHGYESFSPPKFIDEFVYYIKRENKPAKEVELNKRDVPFVIENKFTELRNYIKKNKLKLKTEEEVITLLQYYDSLE